MLGSGLFAKLAEYRNPNNVSQLSISTLLRFIRNRAETRGENTEVNYLKWPISDL